ncbi:MAG: GNAT family N-acetyltransferase [Pyramidobacter sp.]|jgi:ribosomal protein S18 acetylase RimI-like enzyme
MEILDGKDYLPQIDALIIEYAAELGRNLDFQGIDKEQGHLDLTYLPPNGRIFAAINDAGEVKGCAAWKRLSDTRCEMKRLYVRPECRGSHFGRALAEKVIETARDAGYREMVLDMLGFHMRPAMGLFRSLGFEEIPPFYDNPLPDAIYLSREL